MTLEYLEIMEEINQRRKCIRSFKSNTRVFDDNSIEVIPQEKGQPTQTDVKKVGRSKRYATTGKNPLTCIELKCPNEVADKAAYFQKELAKLTRDIAVKPPQLPCQEFLIDRPDLKVCLSASEGTVTAWMMFDISSELGIRKDLYNLTTEIDKCFAYRKDLNHQPK